MTAPPATPGCAKIRALYTPSPLSPFPPATPPRLSRLTRWPTPNLPPIKIRFGVFDPSCVGSTVGVEAPRSQSPVLSGRQFEGMKKSLSAVEKERLGGRRRMALL